MMERLQALRATLEPYPWAYTAVVATALVIAAWLADWVTKRVLLRGLRKALNASPLGAGGNQVQPRVISRLAHVVPAIVLAAGVAVVPDLPPLLVTVVRNVCVAFIILTVALAISATLDMVNEIYQRRPDAHNKPIKGYLQLLKIVVFVIAAVLIVAALIDRSPVILLSGLGAMMAVLILVFQDTLLSLVASMTISSNDMVRVGDWIEMPGQNADGDVIDIALHTVKVQNWDKTISTIPTKKLISESFKNWRGMSESGGRRIKRSLYLDQNSVRFLEPDERKRVHRFSLLDGYLASKEGELARWNAQLAERGKEPVNTRRVTNLGTFRAYVEQYLRAHPGIHQGMTLMVRQLQPTPTGLPLEIYCFTSTVDWSAYENIQSDIFDHLLAILPEFGLHVFQQPGGADLRQAMAAPAALAAASQAS
ncbi:mechanosensitive ion channel family protein [Pseudoxanthomonas sp. UTMC 1351]|uniref:mechanosensitive ion channel family protein n=1 Tax=Pseudoxanthomonas sp. UTMC 1351 TaxID=2695853 RepID=UPI0034CFEC36